MCWMVKNAGGGEAGGQGGKGGVEWIEEFKRGFVSGAVGSIAATLLGKQCTRLVYGEGRPMKRERE